MSRHGSTIALQTNQMREILESARVASKLTTAEQAPKPTTAEKVRKRSMAELASKRTMDARVRMRHTAEMSTRVWVAAVSKNATQQTPRKART